ncbi:hypothetical protein GGS20DRAFT_581128 [Poronia punctata]|nr:hypothetical protein GGS20DRAFT_581128 [Poronia punctata]
MSERSMAGNQTAIVIRLLLAYSFITKEDKKLVNEKINPPPPSVGEFLPLSPFLPRLSGSCRPKAICNRTPDSDKPGATAHCPGDPASSAGSTRWVSYLVEDLAIRRSSSFLPWAWGLGPGVFKATLEDVRPRTLIPRHNSPSSTYSHDWAVLSCRPSPSQQRVEFPLPLSPLSLPHNRGQRVSDDFDRGPAAHHPLRPLRGPTTETTPHTDTRDITDAFLQRIMFRSLVVDRLSVTIENFEGNPHLGLGYQVFSDENSKPRPPSAYTRHWYSVGGHVGGRQRNREKVGTRRRSTVLVHDKYLPATASPGPALAGARSSIFDAVVRRNFTPHVGARIGSNEDASGFKFQSLPSARCQRKFKRMDCCLLRVLAAGTGSSRLHPSKISPGLLRHLANKEQPVSLPREVPEVEKGMELLNLNSDHEHEDDQEEEKLGNELLEKIYVVDVVLH